MKTLFKSKKMYAVTVIIMIIIYTLLIFNTKINYTINFEGYTLLIFNIIIIFLFIFLNILFVIFEKNNIFKKIVLIGFIITSMFIPVKKNIHSLKVNTYTYHLNYDKPYNIINIILITPTHQNNERNIDSTLKKIKEYSEVLNSFDYHSEIEKNGYISENSALKIVALNYINNNGQKIAIKDYIKNMSSAKIELLDNANTKYWEITFYNEGSSYLEKAVFSIEFFTGEIIKNDVILQLNVD